MSATVHRLSKLKLPREANECANMIYDAQAVVRLAMAVIDETTTLTLPTA